MKQRIIFFGSGWYTIPIIEKLVDHGLDLVVTTEKNPESQLLKFCNDRKIQTLQVFNHADLIKHKYLFINHEVAVLASFGAIIPDEIINNFHNGILNIHPSLLPKYKGPSPIQYQLLNGETTVGVTIIKLDNEVDHGPILAQQPYKLQGNETFEDLLSILFEQGAALVTKQIEKLENGEELVGTPQDHSNESWSYKIAKQDGMIDINKPPAKEKLERMIRAYYPWPGVWFCYRLKGQEKIVKLLPENKIQVEGKSAMSFKDFENGYQEEGIDLLNKLHLSSANL